MSRLYLLDDHTLVRHALRSMTEAGGHEVVGEAAAPAAALAELPLLLLQPDVLLLDLWLDGQSGFDVLTGLKALPALAVRTLVLTMSDDPADLAEARRLGAAGYLRKDAPGIELLAAIDAVARGGFHWPPAAAPTTAPSARERLERLSPREREVVVRVVNGESSREIGERLHLSAKTVDTYRSRLMVKLGVADLPALVRFALRSGLIDARD